MNRDEPFDTYVELDQALSSADYPRSRELVQRLLADDQSTNLLVTAAEIELRDGKPEDALPWALSAVDAAPENLTTRVMLARCETASGRSERKLPVSSFSAAVDSSITKLKDELELIADLFELNNERHAFLLELVVAQVRGGSREEFRSKVDDILGATNT